MRGIRLKDIPTFIRTTEPDDPIMDIIMVDTERAKRSSAIVLNTFYALEHEVLNAPSNLLPPIYCIGPLDLQLAHITTCNELKLIGSNLWTEATDCLEWLDSKEPDSVLYINFGSSTVMTAEQLFGLLGLTLLVGLQLWFLLSL